MTLERSPTFSILGEPMERAPTKVVYLVGTSRCGSTLVGSLLGLLPGVTHVGELWRIWEEGLVNNFRCGCGAPLNQCEFWSAVLARASDAVGPIDPHRMMALTDRWARLRHAPRLATERGRDRVRAGMAEYGEVMASVYRAIGEVAGVSTVLDTSKTPMVAWVLSGRSDIDLRILHVTRDPRAVAYSWHRKKTDPAKGREMHEGGTVIVSLRWLAWNGLAAALWERPKAGAPYLQVRYEDLTSSPRTVLDRICDWLGEPPSGDALVDDRGQYISAPAHTVAGNPIRFDRGTRRIAADVEWQEGASPWHKLLVSGLTWPLLGKYRYPLLAPGRQLGR